MPDTQYIDELCGQDALFAGTRQAQDKQALPDAGLAAGPLFAGKEMIHFLTQQAFGCFRQPAMTARRETGKQFQAQCREVIRSGVASSKYRRRSH